MWNSNLTGHSEFFFAKSGNTYHRTLPKIILHYAARLLPQFQIPPLELGSLKC